MECGYRKGRTSHIKPPMCWFINPCLLICGNLLWEMEGIMPYFGDVLNLGWNRSAGKSVAGKRRLLCFSVTSRAQWDGARGQSGTVYKELKQETKESSIFNYVSSEAHVHCLKRDFEIFVHIWTGTRGQFFSSFSSDLHPKQIWMGAPPELLRTWKKYFSLGLFLVKIHSSAMEQSYFLNKWNRQEVRLRFQTSFKLIYFW